MESTQIANGTSASLPKRRLYPVSEARQLLGGIGHSTFYQLVKDGVVVITKVRNRSMVTDRNIDRAIEVLSAQ